MADLSTKYLGLDLPHPFIAGASPLCDSVDGALRLQDGGAAAVVLRSLYAEQLVSETMATHESFYSHADSFGEAQTILPEPADLSIGPQEYGKHLGRMKEELDIPVIGSLNGAGLGPWIDFASIIEEAGADALELNLYDVVADPSIDAAGVENGALEIVREVRSRTKLPIAVKLSPFYSSLANLAQRMHDAGADAFVLFNRFFEPEIDVDALAVVSHMTMSMSAELPLRLRWLAIISGQVTDAQFAVTGGVHNGLDAVKSVMCGANAVQVVSELLMHGPDRLGAIRDEFAAWLDEHEYESAKQMRGSMNIARCPEPSAYARAQYVRLLRTWTPS